VPSDRRVRGLGEELFAVHDDLRARLRRLRAAPADAHALGRDLRLHCLAFCRALTVHHTGEDVHLFPLLAASAPELGPVIEKLAEDHVLIAGLLESLERLTAALPVDPGPDDVAAFEREVDGIAAIVESHFSFEERRIRQALDRLDPAEHRAPDLFGEP
jgi:hypothetical protein